MYPLHCHVVQVQPEPSLRRSSRADFALRNSYLVCNTRDASLRPCKLNAATIGVRRDARLT